MSNINCRFFKIALVVIVLAGSMFLYKDFRDFCNASVPIFAYHRIEEANDIYSVPPKDFDAEMAYLHEEGYTSMTLYEYAIARQKHEKLYKKMVLIFDDGYRDNLTNAAPILQKYGYKGSIFLAVKFDGWPGYLDWDSDLKLLKYGWEIGSHTYNHKPLTTLTPAQVDYELIKSKEYVQGLYNPPGGPTLSYPTGACNKQVAKQVADAGYIAAVCGVVGVNTDQVPMQELKRVNAFYKKKGSLTYFERHLFKAQLASWGLSHGIDFMGMWDKLRGNIR